MTAANSGPKERRTDGGYEIYCGLDVGKSEHHASALNTAGERVFDKPLPQDEARLRELFTGLKRHGGVLVIVDQPNTIGALPIAVARDCGCTIAYLPGLSRWKRRSFRREVLTPKLRHPGGWSVSMVTCRQPAAVVVEMTQ